MSSALADGLLEPALVGVCPSELLLGLQAGGFIDEFGELTDLGRASVDKIIWRQRQEAKQARYAQGRREQYPSTIRDRRGRRKMHGVGL